MTSASDVTCLVICADRNIFDLLAGMLLSLDRRDRDRYAVHLIDVGLTDSQRDWALDHCDGVSPLRDDLLTPLPPQLAERIDRTSPFWRAQFCRPFLPEYFPGYRDYVHLDADMWVQGFGFLDAARAAMAAGEVVIVPESDTCYPHLAVVADSERYVAAKAALTEQILGPTVAKQTAAMPYLNTGFFGMNPAMPHWGLFKEWLGRVTSRGYHHLSEQLTFNVVVYQLGRARLLPAVCNWMCSLSTPVRGADGVWRTPTYPNTPIDLLHLTGTGKTARYQPLGMLYDDGRYLPALERQGLLG
jgi:hypothetical protein